MMKLKPMKFFWFAGGAIVLSTVLVLALLLGVDLYLHHRFEQAAGLNIRGYRGPVVKRKQPGERRVVVLGGSAAFGYGVPPTQSFPAYLQQRLNEQRRQQHQGPISVVNLAFNVQGAYSFFYTLKDYEDLDYDLALLYEGYNDLTQTPNLALFRHHSPIFRLTGYYPIFPMIFQEKAMALRHGGDLEGAYRNTPTVFRPNLAQRTTASALEVAVHINQSLERQLGRLSDTTPSNTPLAAQGPALNACGERWAFYCGAVFRAAEYALNRGKRVLVVTQPYISDGHIEQQQALVGMLRERFGDNPRLRYVNLGRAVDVRDTTLCYDGMHLTGTGNERIAEQLVRPVLEILQ